MLVTFAARFGLMLRSYRDESALQQTSNNESSTD